MKVGKGIGCQLVMASLVTQASAWRIPDQPRLFFPQRSLDMAFRKLFPPCALEGVLFPNLEDLVNREPFTTFLEYLEEADLDPDLAYGGLLHRRASGRTSGWRQEFFLPVVRKASPGDAWSPREDATAAECDG